MQSEHIGQINSTWGKTIVDQLIKQGVDYFCIAPGFRSTPIALAIAEDPRAKSLVHYDERGIAFHALGYAKASGKPVAIVATSGTAIGNLMPAVMEAWASHVPLILLTCDRPAELRDTMANQTADQVKMFGDYTRYFFDLPSPSSMIPENFLSTTIGQAVFRAKYPIKGPIQLNCPFPEPFFGKEESEEFEIPFVEYTPPEMTLSSENIDKWADKLSRIEKGVIVLGAGGGSKEVGTLAETLQWPILPDIISSYRHLASEQTIAYYHHLIKSHPDLKAEAILYFGDALVSKFLLQWMGTHRQIIHVANHPKRCDPNHKITSRIISEPALFCEKITPLIEKKENQWFEKWKEFSKIIESSIQFDLLTEPGVIKTIEQLKQKETALFFGNSMPIRDADMFFFPKSPCGPIFANRGLSGIDGNIATCCGIAQHHPVIGVIGDQTFLHDLNSLAQLKKTKHPIKLIVINNKGGGIFSFVAIGEKKNALDTYFAAAHDISFENGATLFGIPYFAPKEVSSFEKLLKSKESCLIEIATNRQENLALHKTIDQAVYTNLCSSFSTVS